MAGFADDVTWLCAQLEIRRPVVVGHSLGGLVGIELARPEDSAAVVLVDSVLLPGGDRRPQIRQLVTALRTSDAEPVLRAYFASFFGPYDDPDRKAWILREAVKTPPHVTSSVWEESLRNWDDAEALQRCQVPVLYLDAGTPNADLARAVELIPQLVIGRTIGSGHFSLLEVPEQVNAMLQRFLDINVKR